MCEVFNYSVYINEKTRLLCLSGLPFGNRRHCRVIFGADTVLVPHRGAPDIPLCLPSALTIPERRWRSGEALPGTLRAGHAFCYRFPGFFLIHSIFLGS